MEVKWGTWIHREGTCQHLSHVDSDHEYFISLTDSFLSLSCCRTIGKATLTTERSEYYPLLGRCT